MATVVTGAPGPAEEIAYLDHAATAPLRPEAAAAMAPFAGGRFGNPSGSHRLARDARTALEEAREVVASVLGARPDEVVFTAGGTEADNLAVLGPLEAAADRRPGPVSVVCSAVEHAAVLAPARAAAARAARRGGPPVAVLEAPVDRDGAVDLDRLDALLAEAVGPVAAGVPDPSPRRDRARASGRAAARVPGEAPSRAGGAVAVVSVMLANNEVGTVQPLEGVAAVVRRRAPEAAIHTDAVQAAAWLDLARAAAPADLVSVSAHKLGGPKGAGALVVRRGTPLVPLLHGGGQEQERRSGTHDVAGAVGLAAALQATAAGREAEAARVAALRDRLADGLLAAVPGAVESADRRRVLPGHCHLRFPGMAQEELLVLLDDAGVCASGGAACASGALEPSHVLRAMGVPPEEARSALRLTLGHTTTAADVDRALSAVPAAVARLRG